MDCPSAETSVYSLLSAEAGREPLRRSPRGKLRGWESHFLRATSRRPRPNLLREGRSKTPAPCVAEARGSSCRQSDRVATTRVVAKSGSRDAVRSLRDQRWWKHRRWVKVAWCAMAEVPLCADWAVTVGKGRSRPGPQTPIKLGWSWVKARGWLGGTCQKQVPGLVAVP